MLLLKYMTSSRSCREEGGKGMREEMGSWDGGEGGGNLEHLHCCMGLTVT